MRNDGAIPNLPDDDVVEVSARSIATAPTRCRSAPLAPEMLGLVAARQGLRAARPSTAAMSGSRTDALKALMANPLVARLDTARPAARCAARGRTAGTCRGSSPTADLRRRATPRRWPGSSRAPRRRRSMPRSPSRKMFSMKYTDSRRPAASATGNDIRRRVEAVGVLHGNRQTRQRRLEQVVAAHRRVLHLGRDALGLHGGAHDPVRPARERVGVDREDVVVEAPPRDALVDGHHADARAPRRPSASNALPALGALAPAGRGSARIATTRSAACSSPSR